MGFRATCCRMVPEEVRSGNDNGGKLLSQVGWGLGLNVFGPGLRI